MERRSLRLSWPRRLRRDSVQALWWASARASHKRHHPAPLRCCPTRPHQGSYYLAPHYAGRRCAARDTPARTLPPHSALREGVTDGHVRSGDAYTHPRHKGSE